VRSLHAKLHKRSHQVLDFKGFPFSGCGKRTSAEFETLRFVQGDQLEHASRSITINEPTDGQAAVTHVSECGC
jgi:hypothetical protein